jgi:exocyst complex component 5
MYAIVQILSLRVADTVKSRKRKIPTNFMRSLAKSGSEMLASARDAYVERLDSSELAPAQKALLLRLAGLKDSENAKTQSEIEVTDEDSILSVLVAKRMLKWLAETVGRGLELSGGNETAKDVTALHDLLLTNMGEIYIETCLDASVFIIIAFGSR